MMMMKNLKMQMIHSMQIDSSHDACPVQNSKCDSCCNSRAIVESY